MDHDAASERRPFKVTAATLDVLQALLKQSGEIHGFRVAQLTGRPTGSVYPILLRLEQAGWLQSRWEPVHEVENRPRRRFYVLSEDGRLLAHTLVSTRRPDETSQPPTAQRIRDVLLAAWSRLRPVGTPA